MPKAIALDSSSPGILINIYQSSPSASSSPPPSSSSVDRPPSAQTSTASAKRHAPYARVDKDKNKERSQPEAIVPMADLVSGFRIDFSKFPHTSVKKRFDIINQFIQKYSALCVFHFLIKTAETMSPHSSLNHCDCDLGLNSFYRDVFRSAIAIKNYACFRCGCPIGTVIPHGEDVGNRCAETQMAEFLKPIPFIVLNSPEIRPLVFDFLGLKPDHFLANQTHFAVWLGLKSGMTKVDSNLMNVVYAVALLVEDKVLPAFTTFEHPGKFLFLFFLFSPTDLFKRSVVTVSFKVAIDFVKI
jgi:hypothetical protein